MTHRPFYFRSKGFPDMDLGELLVDRPASIRLRCERTTMLPLAALGARSRQGIWPAFRVKRILFSIKIQACILLCEERERLTLAYLEAAEANRIASESVEDIKSHQWPKPPSKRG